MALDVRLRGSRKWPRQQPVRRSVQQDLIYAITHAGCAPSSRQPAANTAVLDTHRMRARTPATTRSHLGRRKRKAFDSAIPACLYRSRLSLARARDKRVLMTDSLTSSVAATSSVLIPSTCLRTNTSRAPCSHANACRSGSGVEVMGAATTPQRTVTFRSDGTQLWWR